MANFGSLQGDSGEGPVTMQSLILLRFNFLTWKSLSFSAEGPPPGGGLRALQISEKFFWGSSFWFSPFFGFTKKSEKKQFEIIIIFFDFVCSVKHFQWGRRGALAPLR